MKPAAFSALHLKSPMLKNLASLGSAEMTLDAVSLVNQYVEQQPKPELVIIA
jgi:hypothetical protein